MLAASNPERIDIAFDDDRLVDHAGLLLPATLAGRLGLRELADAYLDLGDAAGRANAGDKLDPGRLGARRRRLHRRRRCLARRRDGERAGLYRQGAAVAETTYTPFRHTAEASAVRLIVRRVQPTPGSQLALFVDYSYHAFITDRAGEMMELEADHRRHAEIENAIRDLKYGVGLNHLPSGRFAANAAWLAVQVIAHNLARWTARLGLGAGIVTTRTLRRRYFALAGRLTHSARRWTLHLPKRWPWAVQLAAALARLRALPLPA